MVTLLQRSENVVLSSNMPVISGVRVQHVQSLGITSCVSASYMAVVGAEMGMNIFAFSLLAMPATA